jgi:hypothetical protein
MILDTQEEFSSAQSVASAAGDVVSTNVYDTGSAADVGIGEPMWLYAKMNAALVGAGASLQVVLQDSADNSSFADVMAAKVVPVASALANAEIAKVRLPVGLRRYLRVAYRISGATTTGGTASAWFAKDVQAQQYGASGITVQ